MWGRKSSPIPPTRVRSPPHGAAGPSVSAREEGERRRRRLRLGLALPLLLSPPPLPPGPSASEEEQEPFWEFSFAPIPQTTQLDLSHNLLI